jgi:hypothetical protein
VEKTTQEEILASLCMLLRTVATRAQVADLVFTIEVNEHPFGTISEYSKRPLIHASFNPIVLDYCYGLLAS